MAARVPRALLHSRRLYTGLPRSLVPVRHNSTLLSRRTLCNARPLFVQNARTPARQASPSPRLRATARYTHSDGASPEYENENFDVRGHRTDGLTKEHWAAQDLSIVDRHLEVQTIISFVQFIPHGVLPNKKRTTLPILEAEEVLFASQPSTEWGPEGYKTDTVPMLTHAALRLGSNEDPARLVGVGKNIQFMKSRILDGIVPMSNDRWIEKGLDKIEEFDTAVEHLTSVLVAFEYLNLGRVRKNVRDTFNLISGHWKDFGDALNARRKLQDQELPMLDVPALWEQFIRAKYEVATAAAHGWVTDRVAKLQDVVLNDLLASASSSPIDTDAPDMKKCQDRLGMLMRIGKVADVGIWLFMDGYNNYNPPNEIIAGLHNPALINKNWNAGYMPRLTEIGYASLEKTINEQNKAGTADTPQAVVERFRDGMVAQEQTRVEVRGPTPPMPPVPWIETILTGYRENLVAYGEEYGSGIAIYRTAYNVSEEVFEAAKGNLKDHLSSWGQGIPGAEEVKPLLKLYWFDCKELGLDPADKEALKRHFQSLSSTPYASKITPSTFLILDNWALASYNKNDEKHPSKSPTKEWPQAESPFQGHLLAVDPNFDPATFTEELSRADESPGFTGHMRILGNLIWPELFGMLMMQSSLQDLWPLAMEHINKLYTGPVVPRQVKKWREYTVIKEPMMESFTNWLEEKYPDMATKAKKSREDHVL